MKRRGFTLVEALLSFTLMLLVLSQLGQIQQGAVHALRRARAPLPASERLAAAHAQFARDCLDFVIPGPGTRRGAPAVDMIHTVGATSSASVKFFVARSWPPALRDLRRVTYTLEDGNLVRKDEPPAPRGAYLPAGKRVLARGAGDLEFALYDGNQWTRQWTQSARLPRGLSIRFTDDSGSTHHWRKFFSGEPTP